MKKMIAMILSLVAVLSLCACGAQENPPQYAEPTYDFSDSPTEDLPTEPAEPQIPNLDMFVGKWHIVEENFLTEIATFTINADGTLEANGEILNWTAEKAHPESSYEMILTVEYPADPSFPNSMPFWAFNLNLERTAEDTYVIEMRESQLATTGKAYYRECDYEMVELTDENAIEYLELGEEYFEYRTNGELTHMVRLQGDVRFKEGVGVLSHFDGKFVFQISEVEISLGGPDGFTEGAVANTYTADGDSVYAFTPRYPESYSQTLYWFGNPGSETLKEIQYISHKELIGTKNASGYVFIPV